MSSLTATSAHGSHSISIHATGCKHAVNPDLTVGFADTIAEVTEKALNVVDPDNDWPGWQVKIVACAKKVGAA